MKDCEVGTFGKRTQFLLNLNYCFVRLKKENNFVVKYLGCYGVARE